MNILVATIATAMLAFTAGNVTAPAMPEISELNPVEALSITAAGVSVDIEADGLSAAAAADSGLSLTLTLKSGTPIRVSF